MRYTIRTDFERPSAQLLARVASTHVGVTGVHAGPRQVMNAAIKPLDPSWRICGPAFTVRPEDPADLLVGEVAGKYAQPGDVIVAINGLPVATPADVALAATAQVRVWVIDLVRQGSGLRLLVADGCVAAQ